ncbi:MAG: hypothetical protein ACK5MP_12565 [Nostocoides sp.]
MKYVIGVLVLLALGWAIYLLLTRREDEDDDSWDEESLSDLRGDGLPAARRQREPGGTIFDAQVPAVSAEVRTAAELGDSEASDVAPASEPGDSEAPEVDTGTAAVPEVDASQPFRNVNPNLEHLVPVELEDVEPVALTPTEEDLSGEEESNDGRRAGDTEVPAGASAEEDEPSRADEVAGMRDVGLADRLAVDEDVSDGGNVEPVVEEEASAMEPGWMTPVPDAQDSGGGASQAEPDIEAAPDPSVPGDHVVPVDRWEPVDELLPSGEDLTGMGKTVDEGLAASEAEQTPADDSEAVADLAVPAASVESPPLVESAEAPRPMETIEVPPPVEVVEAARSVETVEVPPPVEVLEVPPDETAVPAEPDVLTDADTPEHMVDEGDPNLAAPIPDEPFVVPAYGGTPEVSATEPVDEVSPDAAPDPVDEPAWIRRISSVAEIRDGGYGVGSAAPFPDLAMPYGHPVKAWNDTKTFRDTDSPLYDEAEPHVWFTDVGAAQRAGFRPAD